MNKTAVIIIAFCLIILIVFLISGKTDPTIASTQPSPSPVPAVSENSGEKQVIKATYSVRDAFQPAKLRVKVGTPTRLEVYSEDNGSGCMGSIMIPGLSNSIQGFKKDQTNIFEFTASRPGEYQITCAMGIPHGSIIAE